MPASSDIDTPPIRPSGDPARRPARRPLLTEVYETARLTPHMLRVTVGGDDLATFSAGTFTDHYVKLLLPPPGAPYQAPFDIEAIRAALPREQWPRTRTYSVRAFDPARRRLTIDFVDHGDGGIAGPWAAAARPGDRLQLLGPGGSYTPDPDADWHLMIGDASVIPAIAASLKRVPERVPVHVLIDVPGPDDGVTLRTLGDLRLRWLHQEPSAAGEQPMLDVLRALPFPEGTVHAFVHGEASMVRAVRRHLLVDREVPRDALSASGYWKRSRTEEGWREDKTEWNRQIDEDTS